MQLSKGQGLTPRQKKEEVDIMRNEMVFEYSDKRVNGINEINQILDSRKYGDMRIVQATVEKNADNRVILTGLRLSYEDSAVNQQKYSVDVLPYSAGEDVSEVCARWQQENPSLPIFHTLTVSAEDEAHPAVVILHKAMNTVQTMQASANLFKTPGRDLDQSDNVLFRWLPTFLSVIGLIIAWEASVVIGMILALFGTLLGSGSSNTPNKILSMLFGIVTIVLSLVYAVI